MSESSDRSEDERVKTYSDLPVKQRHFVREWLTTRVTRLPREWQESSASSAHRPRKAPSWPPPSPVLAPLIGTPFAHRPPKFPDGIPSRTGVRMGCWYELALAARNAG